MANGKMKAGGAGCIILLPALFLTIALTIVGLVNINFMAQLWWQITSIVATMIMAVGGLLISIGAIGLRTQYRSTFSLAVGIFGIVAAVFSIVATPISILLPGIAFAVGLVVLILIGVFFILLGIAFFLVRNQTGYGGISLAAGILSLISGALICSIFISIVGLIMLIPAAICAAYVFFKGK